MKKELRNPFGKIYLITHYDEQNGWIYNQWKGMLSVENVMQGASAVLKIMRDTKCDYILNDNLAVTGSWNQANNWIEEVWMPEALGLGLRRFAHLVPPGVFGITSAEEMMKRVGNRFEMRLFKKKEDAVLWLKESIRVEV